MNAVRVALEVADLLLGPLVCRITGSHRLHVWQVRAAPPFRICLRCSRPVR